VQSPFLHKNDSCPKLPECMLDVSIARGLTNRAFACQSLNRTRLGSRQRSDVMGRFIRFRLSSAPARYSSHSGGTGSDWEGAGDALKPSRASGADPQCIAGGAAPSCASSRWRISSLSVGIAFPCFSTKGSKLPQLSTTLVAIPYLVLITSNGIDDYHRPGCVIIFYRIASGFNKILRGGRQEQRTEGRR
jgi:hypothetical protein